MFSGTEKEPICTFGVSLLADGSIEEIKDGEFNTEQAEEIAARMVLLAARIRNAATAACVSSG